jgi:hypothetical protein
MKQIFLFLFVVSILNAQIVDSLFYGNSKMLQKNPYGWGYIGGRNSYGDIGKYQRFDIRGDVNIVGAEFWMGVKKIINGPDSITIVFKKAGYGKEYYDSLSGGPGTTVASIRTTLASFDSSGKGTSFLLASPFNVAGRSNAPESIFVGIEWSGTADDTFALFVDSAKQGEKLYRSWEKLTGVGYTYQRFDEPGNFSWGLDGDLWIALLYKKGLLSVRKEESEIPRQYLLEQNYPNPFNPNTTIGFSVSSPGFVSLRVFDMLGKEIVVLVNQHLDTGRYTSSFSAQALPSGVYFYRLQTGSIIETKKMVLLR